MNQLHKLWAVCCLSLALSACTGGMPTPSATPLPPAASPLPAAMETPTAAAPPSPEPTSTAESMSVPTVKPSTTPMHTPKLPTLTSTAFIVTDTPIPKAGLDFDACSRALTSGNFLLLMNVGSHVIPPEMKAISEAGEVIELGQCDWPISADGRYALVRADNLDPLSTPDTNLVYDLVKGNVVAEFQDLPADLWLSPNGQWIAGEFYGEDQGKSFLGIGVVSVDDNTLYFLTKSLGVDTHFKQLAWSPDGKWLSYKADSWVHSEWSLNLLDVSCLTSPAICIGQTGRFVAEPTSTYELEFSPDSRYLAGWSDDYVVIYDLLNDQEKLITWEEGHLQGMTWFPNRNQLAVSSLSGDIYLLSPENGEKVLFKEKVGFVEAWLTILPPFAPGLDLSVSLAGHDLNLRAEPSLGGAVLRKLPPGTRLTILEGPVEADGYTWWKMQTADGSEGWAVEVGVWYQPVGGE